jgi:Na+/melibiose symporter-like transporter
MRPLWAMLTRYRDYRLLLSASLMSLVGDWILRVGLTYWVYALTGSTLASGGMLMASLLPQLLLGSVAGIFVDRWDRRRTMIATNLLLAAGLLPLLSVHHAAQVWIVYLVMLWESCLVQFFVPAQSAIVPHLVHELDLVPANALNSQSSDVARLIGAALGGVSAALGGVTLLTLIDTASFIAAAGILALIGAVRHPRRPPAVPSTNVRLRAIWDDWAEGFNTGVRTSALRLVLIFVTLTSVGEGIMGTLMAPFVRDILHASGSAYGLIMAAQALGGIIGSLCVAAIGNHFAARSLFGMGAVIFGILDLALFLYPLAYPALWPAFALMLLVGLPATATIAGGMYVLQTSTTDTHRGRVFGLLGMSQGAGTLLGVLIAGTTAGPSGSFP